MIYTNPFVDADWLVNGGGMVLDGTGIRRIDGAALNTEFLWFHTVPLQGLTITMSGSLRQINEGAFTVAEPKPYNGLFIYDADLNPTVFAPITTVVGKKVGAGIYPIAAAGDCAGNTSGPFTGRYTAGVILTPFDPVLCSLALDTWNCNFSISIAAGSGPGLWTPITRLTIPDAGFDSGFQSAVDYFSADNGCNIALCGNVSGADGNNFTIGNMVITTSEAAAMPQSRRSTLYSGGAGPSKAISDFG